MSERSYLSIGEVLALVQQEFPDVTISKIRFLESQGLLDPERTPSGYRKFYPADVERLRWILREQRENFLPLKVIKDRLEGAPPGAPDAPGAGGEAAAGTGSAAQPGEAERHDRPDRPERPERLPAWMVNRPPSAGPLLLPDDDAPSGRPAEPAAPAPPASPASPGAARPAGRLPGEVPTRSAPGGGRRESEGGRATPGRPGTGTGTGAGGGSGTGGPAVATGASFTLDELATAAGIAPADVTRLADFGLVHGRAVGGTTYYDESALVVAKAAAGFARFGLEPRHLRLYRTQAEREAGLFEQVVLPLVKQRNPEARRRAAEALSELSRLGAELRRALLAHELRDYP